MRRGEILKLRWDQVDFERGCIVVENTKNDETREIALNVSLTQALGDIKVNASVIDYVFSKQGDDPPKSDCTSFENTVKRAGLGDFRFHDLSYTFASKLIMAGVDILTVKKLTRA